MLKFLFAGLFSLASIFAYAQSDSLNTACKRNVSLYYQYLKVEQNKTSAIFWQKAFKHCPPRKKIYQNGRILYKRLFDASDNSDLKKQYLDTVLLCYELEKKHFNLSSEELKGKGDLYLKYRQKEAIKAYNIFKTLIYDKEQSDATVFYQSYFYSLLLSLKNEQIEQQLFLNEIMFILYELKRENDKEKHKALITSIQQRLKRIFNCTILVQELEKIWESDTIKENEEFYVRMQLETLDLLECFDSDLYILLLEKAIVIDGPTFENAIKLGKYYDAKENPSKAITYYKQALNLCNQCKERREVLLRLGWSYYTLSQFDLARGYGVKAQNLKKTGEGYYLIGLCIPNYYKTCGDLIIHKQSVYWLASDYMQKAVEKGPKYAKRAQQKIGEYERKFPEKTELFHYGYKEGDQFDVPCLNEKTIIRAK